MGTVYDAVDRATGERVAVKKLQQLDAESLYRFKREFRALADISHPNLVALYELHAEDDGWFFSMERVDGVGLLSWVLGSDTNGGTTTSRRRRRTDTSTTGELDDADATRLVPPPPPKVCLATSDEEGPASGIVALSNEAPDADADSVALDPVRLRDAFLQLAQALVALHDAGCIHRDVKPSNVMVAEGGRVVVLDFGIVAELGSSRGIDVSIVGTPGYMAPEQLLAGTTPTAASDWYAFGTVLYEALAGRRPFLGTVTQVVAAKLAITPPSLEALAPDAPAELVALCSELLATEPLRRPSGADVLRRLAGTGTDVAAAGAIEARTDRIRLVGRDDDLAVLETARDRARDTRCEGVLVHGPSGRGKTTLVEAFLARAERGGACVLRGRCGERESVPYKGLDSLVDALCRVLLAEPIASVGRLLPYDVGALALAFPVLSRVFAIAAKRPGTSAADGKLKERAMRALFLLLGNLASGREVILFIDDLQWGDTDSASVILELLASETKGIFFVGTFRSEHRRRSPFLDLLLRGAADGSVRLSEHPLAPVTRAALRELAYGFLRGNRRAAELAKRIAVESGGSAYLAIELARHAASSRVTTMDRTSLHAVIGARLASLSHDARRLLEVVAIAGAPVRRSVALRVAAPRGGARRTLAQLERAGFLLSAEDGEDTHLQPMNAAVAESLLLDVKPAQQRTAHLALAGAIAERGDPSDVHALAHHYHQAWPLADARVVIDACDEAAKGAAATFAFEVAYAHLQRARKVAIASGTRLDSAFEHRLGEAAARTGHVAVAAGALRRALKTCTERVARAQIRLELSKLLLGQLDTANGRRESGEGMRELGMQESPNALVALIFCVAALVAHAVRSRLHLVRAPLSDVEESELRVRSALLVQGALTSWFRLDRRTQVMMLLRLPPIALRLGATRELAHARTVAAIVAASVGLRRVSLRLIGDAHAALGDGDDPPAAARVAQYDAHVRNFLGEPVVAVEWMQRCLDAGGHMLENLDYLSAVADTAGNLMLRGHATEGLRWVGLGFTRATIEGESNRLAHGHTYRCYAGPLLALLGREAEARKVLDDFGKGLGDLEEDPWRRGQWLAHRAMVYAELGGSRTAFDETVREFRALGLSPSTIPLQLRHFYIAHAMVCLSDLDGTRVAELRWRSARADLKRAAGKHPSHRAHLRALDAAHHAFRGQAGAAREALDEADDLAHAHDSALVIWDVARQRAISCLRAGDAPGAARANETADAVALAEGWTLRRARLLAAVKAEITDPRWPYGGPR
jgi:serine/threonine protein kinase